MIVFPICQLALSGLLFLSFRLRTPILFKGYALALLDVCTGGKGSNLHELLHLLQGLHLLSPPLQVVEPAWTVRLPIPPHPYKNRAYIEILPGDCIMKKDRYLNKLMTHSIACAHAVKSGIG
jgi:hypothetical protein